MATLQCTCFGRDTHWSGTCCQLAVQDQNLCTSVVACHPLSAAHCADTISGNSHEDATQPSAR